MEKKAHPGNMRLLLLSALLLLFLNFAGAFSLDISEIYFFES